MTDNSSLLLTACTSPWPVLRLTVRSRVRSRPRLSGPGDGHITIIQLSNWVWGPDLTWPVWREEEGNVTGASWPPAGSRVPAVSGLSAPGGTFGPFQWQRQVWGLTSQIALHILVRIIFYAPDTEWLQRLTTFTANTGCTQPWRCSGSSYSRGTTWPSGRPSRS